MYKYEQVVSNKKQTWRTYDEQLATYSKHEQQITRIE